MILMQTCMQMKNTSGLWSIRGLTTYPFFQMYFVFLGYNNISPQQRGKTFGPAKGQIKSYTERLNYSKRAVYATGSYKKNGGAGPLKSPSGGALKAVTLRSTLHYDCKYPRLRKYLVQHPFLLMQQEHNKQKQSTRQCIQRGDGK